MVPWKASCFTAAPSWKESPWLLTLNVQPLNAPPPLLTTGSSPSTVPWWHRNPCMRGIVPLVKW